MHGIIFGELKKFVDTQFGGDTWSTLLQKAGLGNKLYLPIEDYPDAEAMALVNAACELTGKSAPEILEAFGQFIAPHLLELYRHLIDSKWTMLDVIERTEKTIHEVVRIRNPGARPPKLETQRNNPNEVVLTYGSERKMCGLAVGIVRGLAELYKEEVSISHDQCMLEGAPKCMINIRRA